VGNAGSKVSSFGTRVALEAAENNPDILMSAQFLLTKTLRIGQENT
jgi:hypothetical protein